MIRKSFRYWLAALLLGPTCALALEIGEIQVNSALNQLFDARIPLPALTPEELGKISIKLAGPSMFKEFGLDRTPALANLVFAIEYNAEGQVYVRVVSTQPIREPSLALLLEFGWPRGKTFREFTVFLDPVQRLAKRPGGRTKTVVEPLASVVYGPESAAAPVSESRSELPASADRAATPEVIPSLVEQSGPSAVASAPAPAPAETYPPGGSYPVAPGDGLWGIALKVRPDPDITREQMMQSLFRANPQAFSKAGINGLKIGATLRIPTLREIADWTGSPAAKRLAEQESGPASTDAINPDAKPALAESAPVATDVPEAFPLPAVAVPEPVAAAPLPESVQHKPVGQVEPPVGQAKPVEPMVTAAQEPEPLVAAPVAAAPEPAVATADEAFSTQMLEPVSATPLLFLAITEMMTTLAEIPGALPVQNILPTVIPTPAASVETAVTDSKMPSVIEAATPVVEILPTIAPVTPVVEPLPAIDLAIPVPAIELAIPVTGPLPVIEAASPAVETISVIKPATPVAETQPPVIETAKPAVETTPAIEPATPVAETQPPAIETTKPAVETTPVIAESVAPAGYRGGEQYGPVSANERLWGIATKVRPDPAISKHDMMQALFMANPQAFSKSGDMNSLKMGAMLRVPTLQEIVDSTGSKVARQLLESAPGPAAESIPPALSGAMPPNR